MACGPSTRESRPDLHAVPERRCPGQSEAYTCRPGPARPWTGLHRTHSHWPNAFNVALALAFNGLLRVAEDLRPARGGPCDSRVCGRVLGHPDDGNTVSKHRIL